MQTLFKEKLRNLLGKQIFLGNELKFKAVDLNFEEIIFDKLDKVTIFSIFPSINTKVCDLQTSWLNKVAKTYPQFDFVAISLDLPTALKEWCGVHNTNNIQIVSDYKEREFGLKTGFLIDEVFLLNRGIIVLDQNNKVIYISSNTNVSQQIDFDELTNFLNTL